MKITLTDDNGNVHEYAPTHSVYYAKFKRPKEPEVFEAELMIVCKSVGLFKFVKTGEKGGAPEGQLFLSSEGNRVLRSKASPSASMVWEYVDFATPEERARFEAMKAEPQPKFSVGDLVVFNNGDVEDVLFVVNRPYHPYESKRPYAVKSTIHPDDKWAAKESELTPLARGVKFNAKMDGRVIEVVVLERRLTRKGDCVILTTGECGIWGADTLSTLRWIVAPTDLKYYDEKIGRKTFRFYRTKDGNIMVRWTGDSCGSLECLYLQDDPVRFDGAIFTALDPRIVPLAVSKDNFTAPKEK